MGEQGSSEGFLVPSALRGNSALERLYKKLCAVSFSCDLNLAGSVRTRTRTHHWTQVPTNFNTAPT
eukprot:1140974-Pelagomonas_calceolata.AAC.1